MRVQSFLVTVAVAMVAGCQGPAGPGDEGPSSERGPTGSQGPAAPGVPIDGQGIEAVAPLEPTPVAQAATGRIVVLPERLDAGTPTPTRDEAATPTFSLAEVRNLFIYTDWTNADGQHLVRVEIRSPSGSLYSRQEVPFDTRLRSPLRVTWPGGPGHPVEVQKNVFSATRTARTEQYLAVKGTSITQFSMRGTWEIDAYLDGEQTPRATAALVLQ